MNLKLVIKYFQEYLNIKKVDKQSFHKKLKDLQFKQIKM